MSMIAIAPKPEAVTLEFFEATPDALQLESCPLCQTTHLP
jgi:hypothetical protein